MRVTINTSTFGAFDKTPLKQLEAQHIDFLLNPYKRTLKAQEVVDFAKEADGMIAGTEPLTKDVLTQLPRLKVISRCGAGMDNVDVDAAKDLGITICSTPFAPSVSVAELTLGFILALLRQVPTCDRDVKSGQWNKFSGHLLFGKKVGIIGFGRIGQEVAKRLAAFGAVVAYNDVVAKQTEFDVRMMPLKELLGWADIVSIHASKESAEALIGAKELSQMKDGAWIVNCARGGLIDENALYAELNSKRLAGAALDVFEHEPYTGPLTKLNNVILTPHIGAYAQEARIEMEKEAVSNLLKNLRGVQ